MELIERYVYAVVQKLPQAQREDISKELRGLIRDMSEERYPNGEISKEQAEQVLMELGSPKELAEKYRGAKKYLIGPEFFDAFIAVLKIVLIAVFVSLGVIFLIESIIDPFSIMANFIELIISLVTVIPTAIGWTILGFVIAEHYSGVKGKDLHLTAKWKVSDLPPLPDKRRQIKRGETIFGLITYLVLILIFVFNHNYFGVWIFDNGNNRVIPFLHEEATGSYLFLLIIFLFGFGVIKESMKLISGRWTKKLVVLTIIMNILSVITFLLLINTSVFWNSHFMQELSQAGIVAEGTEAYRTISGIWDSATLWILISLIVFGIWEVLAGAWKLR